MTKGPLKQWAFFQTMKGLEVMIQTIKNHRDLFDEYIAPRVEIFSRTISEYYDLKQLTDKDVSTYLNIYYNHVCHFSKYFFIDVLRDFDQQHPGNDYILDMATDFAQHYLFDKQGLTLTFNNEIYLFVVQDDEINVMKSAKEGALNAEISKERITFVFKV